MDEIDTTFWNRSWKAVDPARVAEYSDMIAQSTDAIIPFLLERDCNTVCDAGCGCGVYAYKLASNGFSVAGFDISENAVALTKRLLSKKGYPTYAFFTADVRSIGCPDGVFDAVVSRDVIDHMPICEARTAVKELLRITRLGGYVLLTLDGTDDEYESEPHIVSDDGDYMFTDGKWKNMVFHPYTLTEIGKLISGYHADLLFASENGFTLALEKQFY